MSAAMTEAPRVKKVMTQAISVIFEFLKTRERVEVWLYENTAMKIEGVIMVSHVPSCALLFLFFSAFALFVAISPSPISFF